MSKYKVVFEGEEEEYLWDTEEEAWDYANEMSSNCRLGAQILEMSNPGDYPYDEEAYEEPNIEVIEVDD